MGLRITVLAGLFIAFRAAATTLYVDLNSAGPVVPYATWATAATNIQDAVDAAVDGDIVLVTNGVYATGGRAVSPGLLTNRLAVTKRILVQSINGANSTFIQGYQMPGTILGSNAVRCVYLSSGAVLAGFTVTNGASGTNGPGLMFPFSVDPEGGGVFCVDATAQVVSCFIAGNAAVYGGGIARGTVWNSALSGNSAFGGIGNVGPEQTVGGGAISSVLNNCYIAGNTSSTSGGGAGGGSLNNCVVTGNSARYGGGVASAVLNNCTVVGNTATNYGGGVAFTDISFAAVQYVPVLPNNCIIVSNAAPANANFALAGTSVLNYCDTTPLPAGGNGNITNEPGFVNFAGGDFHLLSNSACINSGLNAYAPTNVDLGGNARIAGGTVDVGAFEFQNPASQISYAWLQQFGLATDGTADSQDPDGDGANNLQEWRAGTIPTNAASVLTLAKPTVTGTNFVVSWQSVTNHQYYLQRSQGLTAASFQGLATNIAGQNGTTSYTDTNAPAPGPWFYRVGVQ